MVTRSSGALRLLYVYCSPTIHALEHLSIEVLLSKSFMLFSKGPKVPCFFYLILVQNLQQSYVMYMVCDVVLPCLCHSSIYWEQHKAFNSLSIPPIIAGFKSKFSCCCLLSRVWWSLLWDLIMRLVVHSGVWHRMAHHIRWLVPLCIECALMWRLEQTHVLRMWSMNAWTLSSKWFSFSAEHWYVFIYFSADMYTMVITPARIMFNFQF